ncbi:MAG: hypothetical protein PHY49_06215 [Aliarcobacter skirrowii]|nr:hypothetical protein [Aliarcobacter skirrowii]
MSERKYALVSKSVYKNPYSSPKVAPKLGFILKESLSSINFSYPVSIVQVSGLKILSLGENDSIFKRMTLFLKVLSY